VAGFTERIAVIIDVTADKATKGLKDFKSSVQEAEGFTGKLKAGVGSLGGIFSSAANNPAMLAGGIAAAGTAAYKAVDEFAQLGLAAGKFSDASGLAIEDASRWMEVSGDLGVSTESVASAVNKMNRAIDPTLFHELGIEIKKTADGTTDVNGTFLNVIQHLHDIPDPAQRANEATKLLGKGWQDMAELIQRGSESLTASLADVSDAKVFTPEERKKAEAYRAAMDTLNDVVQDLTITIGGALLPALVSVVDVVKPAGDAVGWLATNASKLKKATEDSSGFPFFGNIFETSKWFLTGIREGRNPLEAFTGSTEKVKDAVVNLNEVTKEGSRIVSNHSDNIDILSEAETIAATKVKTLADRQESLRRVTQNLDDAYSALIDKLNNADAFANLSQMFWDLNDGIGDTAQETRDFTRATAELIDKMDELPTSKKIELITMLDEGKLDEVYTALDALRKPLNIPVVISAGGRVLSGGGAHDMPYGAPPAPAPAPKPPINTPPAGSVDDVAGNGNRSLGAGQPMVINISTSADPNAVVNAIQQWQRRNGPVPIKTTG
jgi:hypothetical protein